VEARESSNQDGGAKDKEALYTTLPVGVRFTTQLIMSWNVTPCSLVEV
jgi:hypothetical protein